MQSESNLLILVIIWIAVCVVVLWRIATRKIASAGLVPAYLCNLALIHLVGAAIFLLPLYQDEDRTIMELGFVQSLWAVIGFGIGVVAIGPVVGRIFGFPPPVLKTVEADPRLPRTYVAVGAISYFVLSPLIGRVPTLSALLSSMLSLLIVGLALSCWKAWKEEKYEAFGLWIACTLGLPFVTVITQGFLGYGTGACLIVLMFVASFYRPRSHLIVGGLIVFYLGLSFYVSYMRDRSDLRDVVWGEAPLTERVVALSETVSGIEWFDPDTESHLDHINNRLNQNNLVGAAVDYMNNGYEEFASGATFWQAVIALVPRAVWPDKPVVAGSMGFVTQYTGITFAEGTSVGIGQVMEFYINFGAAAVLLGFLTLGVLVAGIDKAMADRLAAGDWQGCAFWFMPGIALLQVGGSLVEVTASFGASLVAIHLVNEHLLPHFAGRVRIDRIATPKALGYDR
jgi:hypothetical protein